MFALRGITVSFSIFLILYSVLSAGVICVWRRFWRHSQPRQPRSYADRLFALRLAPAVIATGVTLIFAVPSFLLLEPRSGNEPVGMAAWLLGGCGVTVLLSGIWRAAAALWRASRAVARWSAESTALDRQPVASSFIDSRISVSVLRTAEAPPLTAAGILRPSVWLSGAAKFVLTEQELQTALRHELEHVYRRDNLRKLLLRLLPFPGMGELEQAWREASEMAADDAAVSRASEALDLAAALIKLSRLTPLQPAAELTTALVHSPAKLVNARVERLIAWPERQYVPRNQGSLLYTLCAGLAAIAALAVTYGELLVKVHTATEWLVR